MRPSPLALLLLTPLLATGCGEKDGDDSGSTDDSGVDSRPDYEAGCILVDGEGGYAWLEDALEVASEGSVIALCEGEFDQGIVINKSVSLVGPGVDSMVWSAPVNQPAILVEGAAQVEISGFTVNSTRNGIDVEGSSDVTIHDVRFEGVEVAGVGVTDSSGVTIEACSFVAPGGGGVLVDGGSALVTGNDFAAPFAFAVKATEGAVVDVQNNTVADVIYTGTGENGVSDGFALWAIEGATLRTDSNVMTNNFVAVLTDASDVELSGDQISGGLYGVYTGGGTQSLTNITVTDALLVGVRAISEGDITFNTVSVIGDPEVVDAGAYNWDSFTGGGVTVASNGVFSATDLHIEGYNNNGLLILTYNDPPTTEIDGLSVINTGRRALSQFGGTLALTNAEIRDTRLVVDRSELTGSYDNQTPGLAVGLWTVNTTWDGGGVYNTEDMGIINYAGALQLSNVTIDGNYNYGVWNYQGSVYATGSTVTASSYFGGIVNMLGDLTFEGNTFVDNVEPLISEYTNDVGDLYTTYISPYSRDVLCQDHSSCTFLNNTFTNGSRGIQTYGGAGALIEGNTFENYHSYVVYPSSTTDETVELIDNTFTDIGYYAVRCSSSDMEMDGNVISGIRGGATSQSQYINGEESYNYEYTSTGVAVYASSCSVVLNDLTIEDASYHAITLYDSQAEMYEVEVIGGSESGTSSYGAVRLQYASSAPAALISGLSVRDNAAGHGLQVTSSASLDAGTLIIDSVDVAGAGSSGVSLEYVQDAELSNIVATGNASHGLVTTEATLSLETAVLQSNGGYGAWLDAAGEVTLTDVTAQQNGSGGVYLSGATADVQGNSFDSNTGYGMTCDGTVTFDACSDNDLSNNSDGKHDGCDDSCEASGQ